MENVTQAKLVSYATGWLTAFNGNATKAVEAKEIRKKELKNKKTQNNKKYLRQGQNFNTGISEYLCKNKFATVEIRKTK